MTDAHPFVAQTVLDCRQPRTLAEFYRQLLGYSYRPGDEPPAAGEPDERGADWLVLRPEPDAWRSGRGLAFQANAEFVAPVWTPEPDRPGDQQMMLHLDMAVSDTESLEHQRQRVLDLGGTVLHDRSADEEEPLYVFADPSGHPFCIFVSS
ncbi:VOC family protein [Nocardioides sp. MAHUQ-72]|uniref:VOC family protein n=1 Tax=unclassified Nocardioides TaxID=2615069 RepID=UPI0036160B8E